MYSADHVYLVGGGIASLAAAVFLIRDASVPGENIHILERAELLGGSLDGAGSEETGYLIRGGRMFEKHFRCTFDLLETIPAANTLARSVTDDIRLFTETVVTSSRARLVAAHSPIEAPSFGLSAKDRWDLIRLVMTPERWLADRTIDSYFSEGFFSTNFWCMWCTMFAFQSWHSLAEMRRYMRRFMHLLPGFNRLEGIHRTRYNQFDSIVQPMTQWLESQGVNIHHGLSVTEIVFDDPRDHVTQLKWQHNGHEVVQSISRQGCVFVTLGSMTEATTTGSLVERPPAPKPSTQGAWALWSQIAKHSNRFGRPEKFLNRPAQTAWESFTVTLRTTDFFEYMEAFTGNPAGTGGLVTFKESGWLLSIVLAHQPHFENQEPGTFVFWGYGLHPAQTGDAIQKPMLECTGAEILTELAHQLQVTDRALHLFKDATVIPCHLPHITAQFMPRAPGDRPAVTPSPKGNFAFLGQFCELPRDTVFTVEYSVRTAQMAVYRLKNVHRRVPGVYRGDLNPLVTGQALFTLLSNGR